MSKSGYLYYKCRACGKVFKGTHHNIVQAAIICSQPCNKDYEYLKSAIHLCQGKPGKDAVWGIGDVISAVEDPPEGEVNLEG